MEDGWRLVTRNGSVDINSVPTKPRGGAQGQRPRDAGAEGKASASRALSMGAAPPARNQSASAQSRSKMGSSANGAKSVPGASKAPTTSVKPISKFVDKPSPASSNQAQAKNQRPVETNKPTKVTLFDMILSKMQGNQPPQQPRMTEGPSKSREVSSAVTNTAPRTTVVKKKRVKRLSPLKRKIIEVGI